MTHPPAAAVVREVAVRHGVCIRPVTLRVTDTDTGRVEYVDVPCQATREDVCPPCATRARALRIAQCREGWHADTEPWRPRPTTPREHDLLTHRADLTLARDTHPDEGLGAAGDTGPDAGQDVETDTDADTDADGNADGDTVARVDAQLAAGGVRGCVEPTTRRRRTRSTRRRGDVPDLPTRPAASTTLGRIYEGRDGRTYRPSLFVTLTQPSFGRVRRDTATPVNPATYDYPGQARANLHFAKLLDRFVQNLRRVAGYDVQYFAVIEPQRRGALHAHLAIRGTLPRALLRQVVAATYHQTWWPPAHTPRYNSADPAELPTWVPLDDTDATGDTGEGAYADPHTGEVLPTFDEVRDRITDDDGPWHLARFGDQTDVHGILAGHPDADRRLGYLTKYLTKAIDAAITHDTTPRDDTGRGDAEDTDEQAPRVPAEVTAHLDRLADALRYEPCSATCANWLRYGIQPRHARPRQRPGACRSKAHRRTHLGHAGRRVLVSRKWSGKTIADHKAERAAFVHALLATSPPSTAPGSGTGGTAETVRQSRRWQPAAPDPAGPDGTPRRLVWHIAARDDPVPPLPTRLLHAIAHRATWRRQYEQALAAAGPALTAA